MNLPFSRLFFLLMLVALCTGCIPGTEDPMANFDLTYTGDIPLKNSSQIETSPWGIHFNGMPFHDMTFAQYDSLDIKGLLEELPKLIQASSDLGLKWGRISVDWGLIQDNAGEFHWELLDPMVNGLIEAGIEVYPSLHAGHKVFTENKPPVSQEEIKAWLTFVQAVVRRYKGKVTYWEIWNEPNTTWFWGGAPKASEYMELVRQTALLIREIDPANKVIGGSLARLDVPYADTLFQMGIAEHIDVFSFHPYGVFPEAALKKMDVQVRMPLLYKPVMNPVEGLVKLIQESGKDIELWQGECGYPSAMNGGGWNGTGPYSEEIQAKWILRRAFTDLMYGADVSAYFMLKENKHPHYDFFNYKGLLKYHDLKEKVGYKVFQHLNSVVNGAFALDSAFKVGVEIVDEGDLLGIKSKNVKTAVFKQGESRWIAYWGMTHMQSKVSPGKVNVDIEGLDGDTLEFELVDFFSGKIYGISKVEATSNGVKLMDLPLGDYPYLIRVAGE